MTKTPSTSEGARYERKALRTKLERMMKQFPFNMIVTGLLTWVKGRQTRYDKRKGGL